MTTGQTRYLDADGAVRDVFHNSWTLRFDADGRCVEYTDWYMEAPHPADI